MHLLRASAIRFLVLVYLLQLSTSGDAATFFVSPAGNDANPGSKSKPFASLARAQIAAQRVKGQPVKVWLRGGTYYLPETLVFTAEDSGTSKAPRTWEAWPNETPVVSGGQQLQLKWEPYRDGIMKASVDPGLRTDQLFINGERQSLARYPNFDSQIRIFNGYAKDAFDPERAARWANPKGGFMHAMHEHMWGGFHYVITDKTAEGRLVYEGGWQNNRRMGMHREFRFVENIFEELDAPGEWFLDPSSATLFLRPQPNIDLRSASVEVVRLRHLIEFKGSESAPVRFISLKGLTFRHASRTFMDNKEPLLRSDWTTYRGGALLFNGAEDCLIERCLIDQVGGNAVFINRYNRNIVIRSCEIAKAGANGVAFVGDPSSVRNPLFEYNQVQALSNIDRTPGPKGNDFPRDCRVEDCLIHLIGRFEKQTAAVQIAMAKDITVRHCTIYDMPRAGINIGDGCWGGHVIEFCDIFDTVKETGDHGSFNSWGRDRFWRPSINQVNEWVKQVPDLPLLDTVKPIILRNNRWRCDHGWDIDLDDGSSHYEVRNNLCLNGGLKNRVGYRRVVENNVIVNNSFHPHVWYADSLDVFRRNIVFTPYQPIRVNKPWGLECDQNLLHTPGRPLPPQSASVLQAQSGRDEQSLVADAVFVNPSIGDYRVREGSPALKLGFKNFPMDRFGVQSARLKALARTPQLPSPKLPKVDSIPERDGRVVSWLGGKIKNIVGMGEVSAAGLPNESGVSIVEVPAASPLARLGFQVGDVILKLDTREIDTCDALLNALQTSAAQPTKHSFQVMRNQRRITLR